MARQQDGGFPPPVEPMLAAAAREIPADEGNWAAEVKWDGMRGIAHVAGGRLVLRSRAGRDITAAYPELAAIAAAAGQRTLVIDGEIVAFDGGRPSFAALQRRMHASRPGRRLAEAVPVTFMAFDLLFADGSLLVRSPYEERRALLEEIPVPDGRVSVPPAFPGEAASVLHASRELGLEGVVLKRLGSRYEPGRRSRAWLKIRNVLAADLAVGGWLPRAGQPQAAGALLVGSAGPAGLEYRGLVGSGLSEATGRELGARLAGLAQPGPPFAGPLPREVARAARWARPELVGEVAYAGLTRGGMLRQPVWRGLRAGTAARLQEDRPAM